MVPEDLDEREVFVPAPLVGLLVVLLAIYIVFVGLLELGILIGVTTLEIVLRINYLKKEPGFNPSLF